MHPHKIYQIICINILCILCLQPMACLKLHPVFSTGSHLLLSRISLPKWLINVTLCTETLSKAYKYVIISSIRKKFIFLHIFSSYYITFLFPLLAKLLESIISSCCLHFFLLLLDQVSIHTTTLKELLSRLCLTAKKYSHYVQSSSCTFHNWSSFLLKALLVLDFWGSALSVLSALTYLVSHAGSFSPSTLVSESTSRCPWTSFFSSNSHSLGALFRFMPPFLICCASITKYHRWVA